MLEAVWPGTEVVPTEARAAGWLAALDRDPPDGLLAATNAFSGADLHVLQAVLASRPGLQALLLVGDRGMAGFEELLARPNVAILPEPWTPQALEKLAPVHLPATPEAAARVEQPAAAAGVDTAPWETAGPPPDRSGYAGPEGGGGPGERAGAAAAQPTWASALAVELRSLREDQAKLNGELTATRNHLDELRRHLVSEDTRKSETIQAQTLELAHLRNKRQDQEKERARDELLRGVFQHRDRLVHLLDDVDGEAARKPIAATLRSLDEFLATQGIEMETNPDPGDTALSRVVGSRPRTPQDLDARQIVRKPAFYRMEEGRRKVLRPAEIETLT